MRSVRTKAIVFLETKRNTQVVSMESTKKNTLVFEFPKDAPGPTLIEISRFVKNFGADRGKMDTCYRNADEKCIFFRFKTAEAFNDAIVDNPEVLTFRYSDGNTVQVKMSVAGGLYKYVRIFNLPPEVEDAEIGRVLAKYGKIKKMVREKFPPECELDLYSGIRGAYMDVQKPIPAGLFIRNCKARIFYEGFKNRCFHCKADDHLKLNCPLLAELRKDAEYSSGSSKQNPASYAEALSSPTSVLAARLEAARLSSEQVGPMEVSSKQKSFEGEASGAGCNKEKEKLDDPVDGDSCDDDIFDDVEKEESGEQMEVDDKGLGTKRTLTGVPSQTESEGSNAESNVQRSVPKRQKNQESKEGDSLGGSPLEAIQNVPKEKERQENTEQKHDWKVARPRRNSGKRDGKR